MEPNTTLLIFDPFSGVSGDMILGGLIDVGLPEEWLHDLVASLSIDARLEITSVRRGALQVRAVTVSADESSKERGLADVLEIVDSAPLDTWAREKAAATFRRLAEVEGAVHGVPPEQVHFHEVGAADALVDVIGAAAGLAQLGVHQCFTLPVAVGRGWVQAEHGRLPLPAPATLKLLEGIPIIESGFDGEFATPTGAALLAVLTEGRPPPRPFTPIRSGYGAGRRDPETHPNCLRVILATASREGALLLLQADIDDMSPEYVPALTDALVAAGALDVVTHPVQMKKARTGLRVEALVAEGRRQEVSEALFRSSTTIGLRFWPLEREVLPRVTKTLEWRGFTIQVKRSRLPDGHIRWKAEYDDIVQAATALGWPPQRVRQAIDRELGEGG